MIYLPRINPLFNRKFLVYLIFQVSSIWGWSPARPVTQGLCVPSNSLTRTAASCVPKCSPNSWRWGARIVGQPSLPTHFFTPSSFQTQWRSTFAARYKLLSNPSHSVVQQIESNKKKSFKSNRKEPFGHFHDNSSQKGEGETQENFPNKSRNTPSNFCNMYAKKFKVYNFGKF